MQDTPSTDPRDEAIRAALRDVAALAAILAGEFHATYVGPDRAEYLHVRWSLRMPVMRPVVLTPNTSVLSVMASVAEVAAPVLTAPETFMATDGLQPG